MMAMLMLSVASFSTPIVPSISIGTTDIYTFTMPSQYFLVMTKVKNPE